MCGLGVLFDIGVISLRQQVVPAALLGRVMTSAAVIVETATPPGMLLGGLLTSITSDVSITFALCGTAITLTALAFSRSPLRHAEKYLASDNSSWIDKAEKGS